MPLFTPEDFTHALECPTRLGQARLDGPLQERWRARQQLQAQATSLPLLKALAAFKYHPDPLGAKAFIEEDDPQMAIWETRKRLNRPGRVVLANAAVQDEERFARIDVMVHDAAHNTIEVIDVLDRRASPGTMSMRFSDQWYEWRTALYALAFKAVVTARHFRGNQVVAKLVLADESQSCDIEDLRQFAWLQDDAKGRSRVRWRDGLRAADLGSLRMLREVDVSRQVNTLYSGPVDVPGVPPEHRRNLDAFITWATQLHLSGDPVPPVASKACTGCAFRASSDETSHPGCHSPASPPVPAPGVNPVMDAPDDNGPAHRLAVDGAAPSLGLRKGLRPWQWIPFQFALQARVPGGAAAAVQSWQQLEPSAQPALDFLRALQGALDTQEPPPAVIRHRLAPGVVRHLNVAAHNAPVPERAALRAVVERLAAQPALPVEALAQAAPALPDVPDALGALPWVQALLSLHAQGHLPSGEFTQALYLRSQWAGLPGEQQQALASWMQQLLQADLARLHAA